MHRIALCLSSLVAVTGCAPHMDSPSDRTCRSSADCVTGEACLDGVCTEASVGPDRPADDWSGGDDAGAEADGSDDAGSEGWAGGEVCDNGRDDDSDGEVDEGCVCAPEDSQRCYGGPPATAGIGACGMGEQACDAVGEFGSWGACTGWTGPTAELCDGIDNNCDGAIDEGCECTTGDTRSCYTGPAGTEGVGICSPGSQLCTTGTWEPCMGSVLPETELCDGIDNDCDGTADEGCECLTGETRGCYTGPAGTEGVGICTPGSQVCTAGAWGPCAGSTLPAIDRCDGVDNDCDGLADEACTCPVGTTRSCYETPAGAPGAGTPGVGICAPGAAFCSALPGGGSAFGACVGARTAETELCRTGIDEDCDGRIDEDCGTPTVDCSVADVLFLMDTTGSMSGEIAQIQARLRDTIIPGLDREVADVRFSVARFDDFSYGGYGGSSDVPFAMVQTNTSSVTMTQSAVNTLRASGGSDGPESQIEALYQSATGAGIAPWVSGRSGCAAGTVGYPCFRAGATPIILLFTDAAFHNGPGGAYSYSGVPGPPHTYAQTVTALNAIGAKVLGLMSGSAARSHLQSIARDTGALAADGSPIVFDIGSDGRSLGEEVVRAVQTLCR